jgi:fructan beta-fructosidase
MIRAFPLLVLILAASRCSAAEGPDILVADFEGDSYPDGWKTTGSAFGTGPAKGTLPGQMHVDGFLGKALVNSFHGGDDATGTLTSPEFKLERKFLNFRIGGGKHEGKTCINLLVNDKLVRTATGPNDKPGGSERLDWHTWDLSDLQGKSAAIRIVDEQKGGWGHVTIDHIEQSDTKKQAEPFTADFTISKHYLHLPVRTGAPMRRMKFTVGNETVREFDIELDTSAKPQFWAFADVSPFKGKKLVVEVMLPADSRRPDFAESDEVPDSEKVYREKHRPLFHFTSRFGWLNDPNGLVYHDKEWHLFYQHNPFGVNWGNMHWGHAVSPDLVHWKELDIALYPRKYGDWAFSGSAVVDKGNTSGWGTKAKPPLVLAYTSTARGECIAYSNDNGRTWTEYDKNPVVKHVGRDPKLVWYEKRKHWVMAVYDEIQGKQWIAFHTSPDLKTWTFASRIEGFFECPDLFEMSTGIPQRMKWVLYAADGKYLVGDFNGKEFKPDFKEKKQLWYGNFYAGQTFDNSPTSISGQASRIQIGWANGVTLPGMPFNQQMTVPVELILADHDDGSGIGLVATPVDSLGELYDTKKKPFRFGTEEKPHAVKVVKHRETLLADLDAFEVDLAFELGKTTGYTFDLRGTQLVYDGSKETLTCKNVTAPLKRGESHHLRVLVDRGSIEVFVNGGVVAMSIAAVPDDKNRKFDIIPQNGNLTLYWGGAFHMKSAWQK